MSAEEDMEAVPGKVDFESRWIGGISGWGLGWRSGWRSGRRQRREGQGRCCREVSSPSLSSSPSA